MPSASAVRTVELRAMEARLLRAMGEPCGVLIYDAVTGQAAFRFRRDWRETAAQDADVLEALASDLEPKFREMGAERFFEWIDSSLSASLSVDDRTQVIGRDVETTAQALYLRKVRSQPREFSTHLPLYSIRAAAGGFGADSASEIEDWIEVHSGKPLGRDEFVLRIEGRSMEPEIPDGALCVFKRYRAGSRANQIVLVQRVTGFDEGGEVTIKRYSSSKREDASAWEHEAIGMNPANPDYASWQLSPDERYRTVAIFERVLAEPLSGLGE